MTPEEAARLFADNRLTVDELIAASARRGDLSAEGADAFRTWAIHRLVDDSYQLIRRFGGQSSFLTFLTVTLAKLYREFCFRSASAVGDVPHPTRNRIERSLGGRLSGLSGEGGASPVGALFAQVSCVGTIVGTARFDTAEGLAHARFSPASGYDMIADAARAVGSWLVDTHVYPSDSGDFATGLAALWSAPQLSLVDAFGRDIAATNVVVVDVIHPSGGAGGRWVIADFRADGARVPASLRRPDGVDHDANDVKDVKDVMDAKDANVRPAA